MIKNIFKPLNKNLKLLLPIEVKNVSLKLNDSFFFKKLSLKIDTKLISCFIGPNGAGKTSCIKLLTGLTKPNSGEVYFQKVIKFLTRLVMYLRKLFYYEELLKKICYMHWHYQIIYLTKEKKELKKF